MSIILHPTDPSAAVAFLSEDALTHYAERELSEETARARDGAVRELTRETLPALDGRGLAAAAAASVTI